MHLYADPAVGDLHPSPWHARQWIVGCRAKRHITDGIIVLAVSSEGHHGVLEYQFRTSQNHSIGRALDDRVVVHCAAVFPGDVKGLRKGIVSRVDAKNVSWAKCIGIKQLLDGCFGVCRVKPIVGVVSACGAPGIIGGSVVVCVEDAFLARQKQVEYTLVAGGSPLHTEADRFVVCRQIRCHVEGEVLVSRRIGRGVLGDADDRVHTGDCGRDGCLGTCIEPRDAGYGEIVGDAVGTGEDMKVPQPGQPDEVGEINGHGFAGAQCVLVGRIRRPRHHVCQGHEPDARQCEVQRAGGVADSYFAAAKLCVAFESPVVGCGVPAPRDGGIALCMAVQVQP